MPTYRYRCKSCRHEFNAEQRMADDALVKCPSCRKRTLVRVIGSTGLVFKGSGFYLTDYKPRGDSEGQASSKEEPKPGKKPAGSDLPSSPASPASQATEEKKRAHPEDKKGSASESGKKPDNPSEKPGKKKGN